MDGHVRLNLVRPFPRPEPRTRALPAGRTRASPPKNVRSGSLFVFSHPRRAPRPSPPGTTRPLTTPTPPLPRPPRSPLTRTARPREQRRRGGRVAGGSARTTRRERISARRPAADFVGDPRARSRSASRSRSRTPSRRSRVSRPDVREAPRPPRRERGEAPRAKGARTSATRTSSSDPLPGAAGPPDAGRRSRLRSKSSPPRGAARSLGPLGRSSSSGEEDLSPRPAGRARRRRAFGAAPGAARGDARVPREGADPTEPDHESRRAKSVSPGSRRRLRPSSASGGVRARRRPASAAAFRSVPASAPVRSPPGGSLLPSDEVAFGAHFTREAEMARTLRDPRPKPRAPQARLTTVFDPPRLFTSSRPKERARNKAAMERAWRRQELTEMVVARTVGRIPARRGVLPAEARDDPSARRRARQAAANWARGRSGVRRGGPCGRGRGGGRRPRRRRELVGAEEGRRGGGETEFDQLSGRVRGARDRSDEDGSGGGREVLFPEDEERVVGQKRASDEARVRVGRRRLGRPVRGFRSRAARGGARGRGSRGRGAVLPSRLRARPFRGSGSPLRGRRLKRALGQPSAVDARARRAPRAIRAASLLARVSASPGSRAVPRPPDGARAVFAQREGRRGDGSGATGGGARGSERRRRARGEASPVARALRGPAAAAAKAERASRAARVGHARARARRARRSARRRTPPPKPRKAVRRSARAKASSELWSSGTNAREPSREALLGVRVGVRVPRRRPLAAARRSWKTRGAAPRSPRWGRSRTRRRRDARRRARAPPAALGDASAPASARRRSRSTGTTNARTPPRRNRTTLSRRTRPSARVCAAAETGGLSPEAEAFARAEGERRFAEASELARDAMRRNRREGRRRRARAARAYVGAEPDTPEAGAREKKHGLALVRESLAAELEWARGAGGGGGDGRRSSRRERRAATRFLRDRSSRNRKRGRETRSSAFGRNRYVRGARSRTCSQPTGAYRRVCRGWFLHLRG